MHKHATKKKTKMQSFGPEYRTRAPKCKSDEYFDRDTNRCVKIVQSPKRQTRKRCPKGHRKDPWGNCMSWPNIPPGAVAVLPTAAAAAAASPSKSSSKQRTSSLVRRKERDFTIPPALPTALPPPPFTIPPALYTLPPAVPHTPYTVPRAYETIRSPQLQQFAVSPKSRGLRLPSNFKQAIDDVLCDKKTLTNKQIMEYQLKRLSQWDGSAPILLKKEKYKTIVAILGERRPHLPSISEDEFNAFLKENKITVEEEVVEYTRSCTAVLRELNNNALFSEWDKKDKFFLTSMAKTDRSRYDEMMKQFYALFEAPSPNNELFTSKQKQDIKSAVNDCMKEVLFLPSSLAVVKPKPDLKNEMECTSFLKTRFKLGGKFDNPLALRNLLEGVPFQVTQEVYNNLLLELGGSFNETSVKNCFTNIAQMTVRNKVVAAAPKKLSANPLFTFVPRAPPAQNGGLSKKKKKKQRAMGRTRR